MSRPNEWSSLLSASANEVAKLFEMLFTGFPASMLSSSCLKRPHEEKASLITSLSLTALFTASWRRSFSYACGEYWWWCCCCEALLVPSSRLPLLLNGLRFEDEVMERIERGDGGDGGVVARCSLLDDDFLDRTRGGDSESGGVLLLCGARCCSW